MKDVELLLKWITNNINEVSINSYSIDRNGTVFFEMSMITSVDELKTFETTLRRKKIIENLL